MNSKFMLVGEPDVQARTPPVQSALMHEPSRAGAGCRKANRVALSVVGLTLEALL